LTRSTTPRSRAEAVTRELATRKQLGARALELDPPAWLEAEIGRPTVEWGPDRRAAWRDAAERIDAYRGRYKVQDQERALGAEPPTDLERLGIWKKVMETIAEPAVKSRRPRSSDSTASAASATSAAVTVGAGVGVGAGAGGSAASAENEALNPKIWRPTVRIVGAGR
jgi:hypothetical protein